MRGIGRGGHPDIKAVSGHVGVPDVQVEVLLGEMAHEGEIPANGLPDPDAVQTAGHVVNGVIGDRAVVFYE